MTIPLRDLTVPMELWNGRSRSCALPVRAAPVKQLRNVLHLTISIARGLRLSNQPFRSKASEGNLTRLTCDQFP
jgi:hypothetical protein